MIINIKLFIMKDAFRKLRGVQLLTNREQKRIIGGLAEPHCATDGCANGYYCAGTGCKLDPSWV